MFRMGFVGIERGTRVIIMYRVGTWMQLTTSSIGFGSKSL